MRQRINIQSGVGTEGLAQIKWGSVFFPMLSLGTVVPVKYPLAR